MPSPANIAILIPAAGASKRIGSPKQLLKWRNSTLIEHAIETAKELNQKKIVVVLGAYFGKIKPEIEDSKIEILNNEDWENGLGSSIAAGVEHILKSNVNYDALLILLVDQPLIVPFYLKTMIAEFKAGKNHIMATSYGSGKFGVPAIFDKSLFKELTTLKDDRGAKELLKKYSKFITSIDIVPLVTDIDTEEDYNKIYKANHEL